MSRSLSPTARSPANIAKRQWMDKAVERNFTESSRIYLVCMMREQQTSDAMFQKTLPLSIHFPFQFIADSGRYLIQFHPARESFAMCKTCWLSHHVTPSCAHKSHVERKKRKCEQSECLCTIGIDSFGRQNPSPKKTLKRFRQNTKAKGEKSTESERRASRFYW